MLTRQILLQLSYHSSLPFSGLSYVKLSPSFEHSALTTKLLSLAYLLPSLLESIRCYYHKTSKAEECISKEVYFSHSFGGEKSKILG